MPNKKNDEKYIEGLLEAWNKRQVELKYGIKDLSCSKCKVHYTFLILEVLPKYTGETLRLCDEHYTEHLKQISPERISELNKKYGYLL